MSVVLATLVVVTLGVQPVGAMTVQSNERPLADALNRTVRGTGGALAGSMLTTVFGIGTLTLSVFPAIGNFGVLTGLSVLYSFLASLFVLPAALTVWARFTGRAGGGETTASDSSDDEFPGVVEGTLSE